MVYLAPLLKGVLVPLLVGFAGLFLFPKVKLLKQNALALSVLLGFLAAFFALKGAPSLPPVEANQWLWVFLPAAAVVGATIGSRGFAFRAPLAFGLVLGLLWFALQSQIEYVWETNLVVIGWLSLLGGLGFVAWTGFDRLHQSDAPRLGVWHTVGVFSITAFLLALSGSMFLAQLAGAFAAVTGPAVLLSRERVTLTPAFTLIAALTVVLLAAAGYFFAELSWVSALFLIATITAPALAPLVVKNEARLSMMQTAASGLFALAALAPAVLTLVQS